MHREEYQPSPFHALEQKFHYLDQLPDSLYDIIVTHSHGELNIRIKGILQWREAFLNGLLPDGSTLLWPEKNIRRMVLKRIEVLDIVRYCKNQETLTDSILQDVCDAISSAEQWQAMDPGFDDKLAQKQKSRDRDSPFEDNPAPDQEHSSESSEPTSQSDPQLDIDSEDVAASNNNPLNDQPDTLAEQEAETDIPSDEIHPDSLLNAQTNESHPSNPFILQNDSILEQSWLELSQQWQELEPVFSELSHMLGQGWDLTQGLLASQQWRDIIRYRKLVKQLPWLKQVITALGRLQDKNSSDETSITEQIFEPVKRIVEQLKEVKSPHAVSETSGIRRSDDISRLLPGELVQLGHPQLNRLWHAKRAEHTLLTYQLSGVLSEHEPVEIEELQEQDKNRDDTQKESGPILVCLDGSASMQGEAEDIAKALVLEALRMAWQEQRACYVYLFSGPGQILQHEMDLTHGGLSELLNFLTQTFHGGTDVIKPLLMALEKQQQDNWQDADILLVTDGRFPVSEQQKQRILKLKQEDTRIHGIVIGNWQGSSMREICTCFHKIDQ